MRAGAHRLPELGPFGVSGKLAIGAGESIRNVFRCPLHAFHYPTSDCRIVIVWRSQAVGLVATELVPFTLDGQHGGTVCGIALLYRSCTVQFVCHRAAELRSESGPSPDL